MPAKQHQKKYSNPYSRMNHDEYLLLAQWKVPECPSRQQIEGDYECSYPVQNLGNGVVEFFS
jgi:hypothetical protein